MGAAEVEVEEVRQRRGRGGGVGVEGVRRRLSFSSALTQTTKKLVVVGGG